MVCIRYNCNYHDVPQAIVAGAEYMIFRPDHAVFVQIHVPVCWLQFTSFIYTYKRSNSIHLCEWRYVTH